MSVMCRSKNGIGFDVNNFSSFMTLDSMYRAELGCKGIGRLLWLKEFEGVHISSVYKELNVISVH